MRNKSRLSPGFQIFLWLLVILLTTMILTSPTIIGDITP